MLIKCCVKNCNTNSVNYNGRQLHTFPRTRPVQLAAWINASGLQGEPKTCTRICSDHFLPSDYQLRPGAKRRMLLRNAVPSIFPHINTIPVVENAPNNLCCDNSSTNTEPIQNPQTIESEIDAPNFADEVIIDTFEPTNNQDSIGSDAGSNEGDSMVSKYINDTNLDDDNFEFSTNYVFIDGTLEKRNLESHPEGQNSETNIFKYNTKRKLVRNRKTQSSIDYTQSERESLRVLTRQLKQKEIQIARLNKLIIPVRPKKEVDLIDALHILEKHFQGTLLNLLKCELYNRAGGKLRRYTEDVKDFAIEVFSKSRKAYNLLRNVFVLPHPKSICRLMRQPAIFAESSALTSTDDIEIEIGLPSPSYNVEYVIGADEF